MAKKASLIPAFASEAEERAYWERTDFTGHVDWSKAKRVRLPNPKSTATPKRKRPAISEADIQRGIAMDPDNPELTPEQLAEMRPIREVLPGLAVAMDFEIVKRRRRTRASPKETITLRVDPATVAKNQGGR